MSIASVSRAQTENTELPALKGEWKLDSVKIKQIISDGDTVILPYLKDAYMNSIDCIFPVLKIEADQCVFKDKENGVIELYPFKHTIYNEKITFWFTGAINPVEYNYIIQQKDTLLMTREYRDNTGKKTILVNLIYLKQ
jgi:hypothetical protein